MPVYKDNKRGTWYVSYQTKDPITGKTVTTKKRGFARKQDAIAAEKELILAPSLKTSTTFSDLVALWEDSEDASDLVRQKHREHFTKRFPYYDKPFKSITKADLSRWRADLAKDDKYSTTTKNRTISYVKAVSRFAHNMYDMDDVAYFLKSLQPTNEEAMKEAEKDYSVWTPDEFNKFIACVDHPIYKVFFEFLFWTGCRRGEAIALQKKDVDDHKVTIRYSQRTQKEGLKPTKTKMVRTIAIDDKLWDDMQPLMEIDGDYVFGGKTGLPVSVIDNWFQKATEQAGVKKIRLHDLRHSHASWLICNGVNIVAVSKRLGHRDISTTLNTYTHLLETIDNDMMDKINNAKSCQTHATE